MNLHKQKGAGLIEVLIAVLILATGILGMAAMQLTAKRTGNEAVQRATAVHLAQGLIERMRSNPDELANYVLTWKQGDIVPSATTNCDSASCTSTDLAAYDLNRWLTDLQGAAELRDISGTDTNTGGLLEPSVCITNSTGFVTVAIVWRGFRALSNSAITACGNGSGLYGASNEYRQVMLVSTYISSV